MGKVLCKNISKLIFVVITYALFSGDTGEASFREFQVFDQAYHFYLSYQPEKAVEQFKIFLADFPDSSARDAALFWLAKSLLQMQSVEEAGKTFSEMTMKFPESPYCRYVVQEVENIRNGAGRSGAQEVSAEQKVNAAALQLRIAELEEREKYIMNSAVVLDRMGIYDVPWRSNNIIEDIENEAILYEEAASRNIAVDSSQLNTLSEFYSLNEEQVAYLRRYLVICRFLALSMKDTFDKGDVELLTIDYQTFSGREDRSKLASRLQTHARDGMSLEEMHELYPGQTKFERLVRKDLSVEMKDKISNLHDGETGIFWTEEDFKIIRVIAGADFCSPAGNRHLGDINDIRIFIKELTGERKRGKHATAVREEK